MLHQNLKYFVIYFVSQFTLLQVNENRTQIMEIAHCLILLTML